MAEMGTDEALVEFLNSEMGKPADETPSTVDTPPVETPPAQEEDNTPAAGDEPIVLTPAGETPPVVEDDELTKTKKDNEELRKLLNEFASGTTGAPIAPVQPAAPQPTGPLDTFLSPEALKSLKEKLDKDEVYLTPEELDSLVDNPVVIQAALNKSRRSGAQSVMEAIPFVVTSIVKDYLAVKDSVTDFYATHKDLVAHKPFVSFMHKRTLANPEYKNKSTQEQLEITAKEARKTLRLGEPGAAPAAPRPSKSIGGKPSFGGVKPGAGGKVPNKEQKPSGEPTQQDYIADVLKGM